MILTADTSIAADFFSAEILGFQSGSLIVSYVVNIQENSTIIESDLAYAIVNGAEQNGIDPDSVTIESKCILKTFSLK